MPAILFLRPNPRAFLLLTETHALIFRQPNASESKAARSVVVAEFVPVEDVDMRGLVRVSKSRPVDGVLGVTSVPSDRSPIPEIFLLLVTSSATLSPLLPSSALRPARVVGVEFYSLTSAFWDGPDLAPSSYGMHAEDEDEDPYFASSFHAPAASSSTIQSHAAAQGVEHPCAGMKKYLESGGFFYAEDSKWDLSTRMGETNWIQAEKGQTAHPLETFDERFVWNASLLAPFIAFRSNLPLDLRDKLDEQALLIPVIQGFVGSLPVSTGAWSDEGRPEIAALGMVSRLSWKRAGARFRTRGIDDDGQVANFAETEVILATSSVTYSWVIVRGSVPLFWQQPTQGLQTLQQKVEITRPPQASQPAFDKHFMELLEHYHSVHAVNLLGQKDAEAMLSASYSDHLESLKATMENMSPNEKAELDAEQSRTVELTPYDFHATVRTHGHEGVRYDFGTRLREVIVSRQNFGWTAVDSQSGQIVEQQRGVFRVNCLDCLDRTNYVQDVMSLLTLNSFLDSVGSPLQGTAALSAAHRELWADNGDRLSKIYAGTGALNTSATRSGKKTFAGLLSDATKSVGRAYINNFQDKGKQAAIDMLLGMMAGQRQVILFDPISDSVQSTLSARIKEYSRSRPVTIFSGTWNLNGKAPDESLDPWLFPDKHPDADIYMIAFQEIVELTAGQILQTDPAKRRRWEKYIMDTFAMRKGKNSGYILYRSEQLVGTALIVVVKSEMASAMRHVESSTKKTGLQGLSGNKGGVGIRFSLFDSTFCFMTCHLAAGHSNVTERNADYRTINGGLKFLRGKTIEDHDIVIWSADFNYRIDDTYDTVRDYAETDRLDSLLGSDQLLQAMDEGEIFQGYSEGPITFRPTYKYDNGTDIYDSSEKARIPAWTDRVLYKGQLKLKSYDRAELRTSDHRPVYAVFDATVREVDQAKKDKITREVMAKLTGGKGLSGMEERGVKDLLGDEDDEAADMLAKASLSSQSQRLPMATATKRGPAPPPPVRGAAPSPNPTRPVPSSTIPKLPPRPSAAAIMGSEWIPFDPLSPVPLVAGHAPQPVTKPPLPVRKPTLDPTQPTPSSAPPKGSVANAISAFETTRTKPTSSSPGHPSYRKPPPIAPRPTAGSPDFESPSITPASTGDYMIVTTPSSAPPRSRPAPPLPERQPSRKATLDLDGSPPKDLPAPVMPDQKSPPKAEKKPPPVVAKPKNLRSTSVSSVTPRS